MACLRPLRLKNPRYKKQTASQFVNYCKNYIGYDYCIWNSDPYVGPVGWLPPDYYISVPCGKCLECKKRKRLEWSLRLMNEMEQHKESTFLTLTLDDNALNKFSDQPKRPLLLYIDRLRKHLGFRPKYFFVSEYGDESGRLHYHGIIFGSSRDKMPYSLLRGKWSYGLSWIGDFSNFRTANYVTKYLLKQSGEKKPFILCSNGIGEAYVTKSYTYKRHIKGDQYVPLVRANNAWYPMPKYYTDKLLDDDAKLFFLLNRQEQTKWYLRGVEYKDEYQYLKARDLWYKDTLRYGLSDSLTNFNYGKLHFSETGNCETKNEFAIYSETCKHNVRSWCLDAGTDDGCTTWRQDGYQFEFPY